MDCNRAPGPDIFTRLFYRRCLATIKGDLMEAIAEVQWNATAHLEWLNQATMNLLPKKCDAATSADYRPISLICSFTKLIAKIMASRLQKRMKELVRPCQNTFIKGRTIHDNFSYVS